MTATIGGLKTRVLIAHGENCAPVEVGTLTIPLRASSVGHGVGQISMSRYRRDLAIVFLRMAWGIWRARA